MPNAMASESSFNARPYIQAFVATSVVLNPTRAPWILYINRSCAESALHGVTCDTATWAAMSTSFPATSYLGRNEFPGTALTQNSYEDTNSADAITR